MLKPYKFEEYLSAKQFTAFKNASDSLVTLTQEIVDKNKLPDGADYDEKADVYGKTLRAFLSSERIMQGLAVINKLSQKADHNYIASFKGNTAEIFSAFSAYCSTLDEEDFAELRSSNSASRDTVLENFKDDDKKTKQLKLFAHDYIATARIFDLYITALLDSDYEEMLALALEKIASKAFGNVYGFSYKDIDYKELLDYSFKNTKTIGELQKESKKKNRRKSSKEKTIEDELELFFPAPPKGFSSLPSSPVVHLLKDVLNAGANLDELPAMKARVSHSTTYSVSRNKKSRTLTSDGENARMTVQINDIGKLKKSAKKINNMNLSKINEQAVRDGKLIKNWITYPLDSYISLGMYSDLKSARRGFKNAMDSITSIKLKGTVQNKKNKEISMSSLRVLFIGYDITKNQCHVQLNPDVNWEMICQYSSFIPNYYYRLPNKASELLDHIFYLARQHTKDISSKGYFDISFRSIQSALFLPDETRCGNPQRDIKDVIDDAVASIEEAHKEDFGLNESGELEFSMLQHFNPDDNITKFLDNGFLRVFLKGKFAKDFLEVQKSAEKKIEASKKKKESIKEKALAINLAKSMETSSKGKEK